MNQNKNIPQVNCFQENHYRRVSHERLLPVRRSFIIALFWADCQGIFLEGGFDFYQV